MAVKLTKNELKVQKDRLKQFQRYLPTLQLKKQQLQSVVMHVTAQLEEVERQTGYSILFENEDVDVSSPVTATFKDATLRTVLDTVLDKSLRYTVKGGGETGHHLPAFAGLRSGGPERGTDRLRHGHLLDRQPAHRRGQHLR